MRRYVNYIADHQRRTMTRALAIKQKLLKKEDTS